MASCGRAKFVLACFLLSVPLAAQLFRERALEAGIDHHVSEHTAMAGGVAIFDFDNDGFEDVYLTGGLAADKLYHNQGDGTFLDVTKSMRLTAFGVVTTMGVVAGDVDNDGFTDLFVTTTGENRNYLLRNVGGKYFTDVSLASGLREQAWSTTATLADYDRDGDLDLYVGNYLTYSAQPFEDNITAPEQNFFYVNDGKGRFQPADASLLDVAAGCTLVTAFSDFDGNGTPDLFVLNDFGDFYEPNQLFGNDPATRSFRDLSREHRVNAAINSMGLAAGDVNADGRLDYYVTNIGENILYVSTPDGGFRDRALDYGVVDGTHVSWGTAFLDVDNDGQIDLFFANGDLSQSTTDSENQLFLGRGDNQPFADASATLRVPGSRNKARGAAVGDLNNDGFPDLLVSASRVSRAHGINSRYYENSGTTGYNWFSLQLEGRQSNRAAIGARVVLYAGGREYLREVTAGGSYLSSHSFRVNIGLGRETSVDSLVVYWPRIGAPQVVRNLEVNRHYTLIEGEDIYLRKTATQWTCPEVGISLGGQIRKEAGIYRAVLPGNGVDTLLITRLRLLEPTEQACRTLPDNEGALRVYPNPAHAAFTVQFPQPSGTMVEVSLHAPDGRVVWRENARSLPENGAIRLRPEQGLPAGVYFLRVGVEGTSYQRRVILR